MTQKQVDFYNNELKSKINHRSSSTQTGEENEISFHLENKKTARIYYSTAYKDKVLSLNFGSSKSFIFTRLMWNKFKTHFDEIEKTLNND